MTVQELKQAWMLDKANHGVSAYLFYLRNQPPLPLKKTTSNLEVELCFNRKITLVRIDSVKLPFNMSLAKKGNSFQYDNDNQLIDCTLIDYTPTSLRFSITIDGAVQIVELQDTPNDTSKLVMKTPPFIGQSINVSEQSKIEVMKVITDWMILYDINTSADLLSNPISSSLDSLQTIMCQIVDTVYE